ncbi:hypothetical protein CHU92_03785 [Flavobacterium cyanobacteriorum]|uniref:Ig-like domain-containing protein n=1 Tax=Flavobacterium cyanobacteriorum TaxID=2022802 RepID=A0A255ZND9_9FLAO|nr:gliding motility-associated C-terminal domain-containing protein [Flavobacterium cyanobacteriorum]OYQ42912.1 hypothetical protein CHU92_03785 [Flavobacterium cyanobacteriorum]
MKLPLCKTTGAWLLWLFFGLQAFAQLPDFTLTLTSTPETCNGNGSIGISVSGTNPAATMIYTVYLLPDENNYVTQVNAGPVLNRGAGNYKVVATQSLGAESNTRTAFVTIANNTVPLLFGATITRSRCGNDGAITVNVTSGTAVSYQIIQPFLSPVQASNVFSGLAPGLYKVKATGSCGQEFNIDVTVTAAQTQLAIDAPEIAGGQLPGCNQIQISHFYGTINNFELFFPLTFTFSVNNPNGGAPTVITQTVASGSNLGNDIVVNIPFYNNQAYSYTLSVTNACGAVTPAGTYFINRKLSLNVVTDEVSCGDNMFTLEPDFFVPPYTVSFTSTPDPTFNPVAFNPAHPNFTGSALYGGADNTVPEGNYTVSITDACGRTATQSFLVEDPEKQLLASGTITGCDPTGTIQASVSGRNLVSVIVNAGPPGYPVPQNISSSIQLDGTLERANMPPGTYQITAVDECGEEYTEQFTMVPVAGNPTLTIVNRPGCGPGTGSVRITLPDANASYTLARIIDAPDEFTTALPYVVTSLAVGDDIYINSLPAGAYVIETVDNCNITRTQAFVVEGYAVQANNITVTPRCGSFELTIQHVSNGTLAASFWLQKFNPATNTWGHPGTGVAYPENTLPTALNSVFLNTASQPILNLQYSGQLRILKVFYTFGNGTVANQRCHQVIHNFNFSGFPDIINAYSFPCAAGLTEVALEATGVAPLTFRITEKNSVPFVVNNGTSNIFGGLEPATYMFTVTDACGNSVPRPFTINNIAPPSITMAGFCEGENSSLAVQQFPLVNYEWYEVGNPGTVLSNTNVLSFPAFNSATDAGTYTVRLISATASSCINQALAPVTVVPNNLPNAGADNPGISICSTINSVNLADYLVAPFDAGGSWQDTDGTGQLSDSTFTTTGLSAGNYTFTYVVAGDCNLTDEAMVTIQLKQQPAAPLLAPVPAVCTGSTVQLQAPAVPGATYSWTGPSGFTSNQQNPVITSVGASAGGTYSLAVTVDGCTSPVSQVAVTVNPLPDFSISGSSQLCAGQSTSLTVVPGSGAPAPAVVAWYRDEALIPGASTPTIQVSQTGTYRVEATSLGCPASRSFTITENTINTAILTAGGCDGNDYMVRVTNTDDFPGGTYLWSGPAGFTAEGEQAVITGLPAGDYTVTVNIGGCERVSEPMAVSNSFCRIPKGISPNGDGFNNNFDLSNFDVKNIIIFNRYGLRVYEQDNYTDEWHGQSSAGELPTGTYYYVVSLSSGKRITGWVYLQREI